MNTKSYVAYKCNCYNQAEELLKLKGSHVQWNGDNIAGTVQYRYWSQRIAAIRTFLFPCKRWLIVVVMRVMNKWQWVM